MEWQRSQAPSTLLSRETWRDGISRVRLKTIVSSIQREGKKQNLIALCFSKPSGSCFSMARNERQ